MIAESNSHGIDGFEGINATHKSLKIDQEAYEHDSVVSFHIYDVDLRILHNVLL